MCLHSLGPGNEGRKRSPFLGPFLACSHHRTPDPTRLDLDPSTGRRLSPPFAHGRFFAPLRALVYSSRAHGHSGLRHLVTERLRPPPRRRPRWNTVYANAPPSPRARSLSARARSLHTRRYPPLVARTRQAAEGSTGRRGCLVPGRKAHGHGHAPQLSLMYMGPWTMTKTEFCWSHSLSSCSFNSSHCALHPLEHTTRTASLMKTL